MADDAHPLPLLRSPAVLREATVLEVDAPAQLVRIARDPTIGRYLLARLSDTVALVDPGSEEALVEALRASGHTPKTAKLSISPGGAGGNR